MDGRSHAAEERSGWRSHRIVMTAGLAAILVGLALAAALTRRGDDPGSSLVTRPNRPIRPFDLENLRPHEPPVAVRSTPGHPVIVNFWASWCVPCRKEMPVLQRVHEQMLGRVQLIGVDTRDRRSDALAFLRRTAVTYASGYDPSGDVATTLGVYGLPTTLFIGADGRVLEQRTGGLSERELRSTIVRLFSGDLRRKARSDP